MEGVYKIENIINGHIYIGSSKRMNKRLAQHKCDLKAQRHENKKINTECLQYGFENFRFEIVEICDNYIETEQMYIDKLNPFFNSYPNAKDPTGYKHKESTISKMSATRKGKEIKGAQKLTTIDIYLMLNLNSNGHTQKKISEMFSINPSTIRKIKNKKMRNHGPN